PWFLGGSDQPAHVVRRQQYDREMDVAVGNELLDDGFATIHLLMKDDWLKTKALDEPRNLLLWRLVSTVDDKHTVRLFAGHRDIFGWLQGGSDNGRSCCGQRLRD